MARPDVPAAVGEPEPLDRVRLLTPVPEPPSIRDFYAFEAHVATARRSRGLEMEPDWYELPVFYFTNPAGGARPRRRGARTRARPTSSTTSSRWRP